MNVCLLVDIWRELLTRLPPILLPLKIRGIAGALLRGSFMAEWASVKNDGERALGADQLGEVCVHAAVPSFTFGTKEVHSF